MTTLDKRIDLELLASKPVTIDSLGITATLLVADRVRVNHKGGIGHQDHVVIRFESSGKPPQDVAFGPKKRVATVFGYTMAVFGGATLSVFPPGQPAMP